MDNNEFYQIIEQADVLFREGEALFQQNNFNDYYEVFDTASKLYLKVESWEKYLWCRYRMTIWLSARNHIKEAKAIGEEELKLCYQKIKGIHELKAEFHYRLFFCNFYQSNYDEATKEAQEALSMAQALKNRAIIVKSYNALASICTHTNKYIIGLTFLFKALPHTKLIERKVETIYVYQTMGHIYFHLRQFYLSKIYLRRTITLCEKQYGNEHPHIINPIMIIGTIKGQEGHYEEAIIDFEKAINLKQKIGIEDRELTSTFFDLARMKAKLGNWNEANEYFEKAIQLQKKVDENNYRWLSNSYFRWAGLLKQNNRLKEAKIFAKKSREVLPKSAVFQLAYAYILETKISRIERDWATALRQLKKANEYLSEIVLNQKEEVYSLNLELYELQLNVYLHYCKENRSRAYLDAALLLFVNIQQLIGNARTVVFETKDQLKLGQEITKIYQIATDILYELYLLEPGGAFLEQIFSFSEKNKVHSLLLTIQDLEALQLSTIPNKQLKELRTLQSQINEYQTTLQRSEDGFQEERFDQYAEELVSLQVRYHQMIKEIEQNHPEYLQLKHQTTEISLQEIQNQLPIGEGAISYTLTENSLYILCILSKQVFLQQMEISVGFYDLINTFIDEGILGMNRKTYVHEAYQLYQILIAPIEDKLVENKVESLLILPDSQLLELPFEALLTQEASFRTAYSDMPYLLKDYSIRYHYSATLRQYQQNRKANLQDLPSRFLGFAPVYDEGYSSLEVSEELEEEATRDVSIRGKNYKALLYSEKEVNDI
ncbi:MAG: tetratricopeptide repeat protein, partial [Chitinophagales bacterium]